MSATRRADDEFEGTERFNVVRRLGAGGMGVVYHVFDRSRGGDVALKTLRRLEPAAIYHLKREFRALADVRHTNLVRLHELFADDGQWFFTMELVEGRDFLEHVRSVPPPVVIDETMDDIRRVPEPIVDSPSGRHSGLRVSPKLDVPKLREACVQLARGVCALHAVGKLHRDIKPSNVMVTPVGRVVLLDFGLAVELTTQPDPATLQSIDQHVLGTPEYMSPEQGAARVLTPASDWYSVGVMLFEALTGGLPFVGSSLEILMGKERADGPAPSAHIEGLPMDLDRLCADLLRRRPADRPTGEEVLRRLAAPVEVPASIPPPSIRTPPSLKGSVPPLVGRAHEAQVLEVAFQRSRQGRSVAVHLHGSAGVGKTALVRTFLEEAPLRHHALVLSGACYERESVPYKALDSVIDELSRHLRRLTRLQVEALLPRDVLAVAKLFPVLMRVEAIASAPRLEFETPDPNELRRRAFAALRELFARIADRRPLIIAIDDLQWGDVDSVALLTDVLRPPYPPPIFLIASFRDDEKTNPTLRALLEMPFSGDRPAAVPAIYDLRASSTTRRRRRSVACEVHDIALAPLPSEHAKQLAVALLGEASESFANADAVATEAAGNPFLITEFVRYLRGLESTGAGAPPRRVTLEAAMESRLSTLDDAEKKLLDTLAVAARPLSPLIASRAAGISDGQRAITTLREKQLVRTSQSGESETVQTYHDRIREVVILRLAKADVADAHLRIAGAIEAAGHDDAESLALHFRAAGARWKASHYAALAARKATNALAFDRAASLYRQAIELAPPNAPELHAHRIMLGDALVNAGRGVEAAHEYLAAAANAPASEVLELHRRAAQHLLQSGHVDEGLSVFTAVLESFGTDLAKTPRRALASLFFRRTQLRIRGLGYVETHEDKVPSSELTRIDTFWAVGAGLAMVDTIRGADFMTRHTLLALRTGEPSRLARAFTGEACFSATMGSGARDRTAKLTKIARSIAERSGQPQALALATTAEAYEAFFLGRWRAGRELFELAERTFRDRCAGVAWELANVRVFLLACLANLGELRDLGDRLPALLEEADARGDRFAQTTLRIGQASIVWAANDDPDGGRRDVRDAVSRWSQRSFHLQHYYELAALTQLDLYVGDVKAAWKRVSDTWPALERSMLLRAQRVRIEALYMRARCALAAIEGPREGLEMLRDAERLASRIEKEHMAWGDPFAWTIRAALAHTGGDDGTAIEQLRRAAAGFEGVDMVLLANAVKRRLGILVSGDEGTQMRQAADAWFATEEVQDPARMTDMLIPGFATY